MGCCDNDDKVEVFEKEESFVRELGHLINRFSKENCSDTPDFILAEYMYSCLKAFEVAVRKRGGWYSTTESFGKEESFGKKENLTLPETRTEKIIEKLEKLELMGDIDDIKYGIVGVKKLLLDQLKRLGR